MEFGTRFGMTPEFSGVPRGLGTNHGVASHSQNWRHSLAPSQQPTTPFAHRLTPLNETCVYLANDDENDDMKEDVSKNEAESVVMDVGEFLNGEDENLVCKSNVGSLVVGHESNIFEVDEESGTLSVYDSSVHDFSKRVLTCDDMFYKKWNLKDLSEVIDTTKDSKALLELSKEVDQDNHGLEGNFMGDSGLGNDV
ncbi:hypothetical protein Tco_1397703, partial [Tanacetum coccineum]